MYVVAYQICETIWKRLALSEIYLKLTDNCNLKCLHCYNGLCAKGKDAYMSRQTIDNAIELIRAVSKEYPIVLNFHGGEVVKFSQADMKYVMDSLTDCNVRYSVTTNLVYPLTDEIVDIIRRMNVKESPSIQTSWDYHIRFKGSQEELWRKNVGILIANGIEVQPTICVSYPLIRDYRPKEVFEIMMDIGIKKLNFERLTNTGNATLHNNLIPTNKDTNEWLYDAYIESKQLGLSIPLFENVDMSLERKFVGCRARKCHSSIMTINIDGTICGCPNTTYRPYGQLLDKGMVAIDESVFNTEETLENTVLTTCLLCEYYPYCNGDCYQLTHDNTGCSGLYKIYQHIVNGF